MNISIEEFLRLNPSNIIDIRNSQIYSNNHIPKAINVPYDELIVNPSKYLNKGVRYYIYCQKGFTSKRVVIILNNLGYNTVSINGGYEEWIMKR